MFDQSFSVFFGVGHRGGAANKLRIAAIKAANALQAAQNIGDMAAKDASIDMHLIYHNKSQFAPEGTPGGVLGHNTGVEHIRVGDQDVGFLSNLATLGAGCIAVIGLDTDGY